MSESICDVTERLFAEFTHVHPLLVVTAAVRQARHDLQGSPESALPALVEKLARCRLAEAARHHDASGTSGAMATLTVTQLV